MAFKFGLMVAAVFGLQMAHAQTQGLAQELPETMEYNTTLPDMPPATATVTVTTDDVEPIKGPQSYYIYNALNIAGTWVGETEFVTTSAAGTSSVPMTTRLLVQSTSYGFVAYLQADYGDKEGIVRLTFNGVINGAQILTEEGRVLGSLSKDHMIYKNAPYMPGTLTFTRAGYGVFNIDYTTEIKSKTISLRGQIQHK